MKKTDGLTRAVGILLFAAMLCYIGFAAARRVTDAVQTTIVSQDTLTLSVEMTGLIVRRETLVQTDKAYVDLTAQEGLRLAAGETVATVYASEQALERAVQLRALEEEIAQLEAQGDDSMASEPGAAYTAVDRLAAYIQHGDALSAAAQGETLSQLLFPSEQTGEADGDYLRALKNRYNSLSGTQAYASETITASSAGLFTRVADGLESVTPEDALALTPQTLRAYLDTPSTPAANAIGKIAEGFTWYYAALMDEADAARLSEGEGRTLRFERYCSGSLNACVESVGQAQNGECVVVFSLDEGMAQLLGARRVSATLEYESCTGLRAPTGALYRYWVGTLSEADARSFAPGDTVTLMKGSWHTQAVVSELTDAAEGKQIVLCWQWSEDNAPPASARDAAIAPADGAGCYAADYYDAETQQTCLCVFTMTGRQAERRKVSLVYVGDDYVLLASQGDDALRAGNELIVRAQSVYDGRVFD